MEMFKTVLVRQDPESVDDLWVTEYSNMDMKGYFPPRIMNMSIILSVLGVAAGAAPGLRLMDFPLTGECTQTKTNLTNATFPSVSVGGCSPWNLATCAGVVTTATVTCGGPEDLPCIAAILAATGSCGSCVCALIGYDCYAASSGALAEFGTCEELGYTQLQKIRDLEDEGVNVVVEVFSKIDDERHLHHVLDVPEEGFCSQMRAREVSMLSSNATVSPGSCAEAGFEEFNTFGTVVASDDYGVGGCSASSLATCAGVVTTATITCGGPEDLPCIAAILAATGSCGPCVCALIGYDCASAFPVEVYAKHDNIVQV